MIDKLKGALRSFTVWFNGMLLLGLPVFEALKQSLPDLQTYLPDNVYKTVGVVVVLGNIALRFRTTTDLAAK